MEPHQVAVVSTHERLKIPRNMMARWSLRVTKIYEGLLWTGGPQVDPGWEGPLFCPIYNLAERSVLKHRTEPTIDFAYTTERGESHDKLREEPGYSKRVYSAKRNYPGCTFTVLHMETSKKFRDFAYKAVVAKGPFLSFWPMTALFFSIGSTSIVYGAYRKSKTTVRMLLFLTGTRELCKTST